MTGGAPPPTLDETPPGLESPGVRERFARLKIDASPLRISPSFRWFWLGQAVKDLGGGVIQVALPYQVYLLTGSTLAVAAISFVELVPLLTLTLVGGALAERIAEQAESGRVDLADLGRRARHVLASTARPAESQQLF